MTHAINIDEKFSKFSEHWRPKIVAQLNGQDFKLAKIKGEYPFHAHEGEDEMFFCWKGEFILDFDAGESVPVKAGECIVVPKGVRHRPRAEEECHIFLIEPQGVKNNGDTEVDAVYDAPMGEWV
jgi:mannose-6-phosphate isomerase-like protein (cupin superfamily)